MWKCLKSTPKMTKNQKLSNFQRFYAFFPKVLTDVVDWNVGKGQQGKNVLSSMHRKKINAVFQTKTVRNWHRKSQKFDIFPIFTIFFILSKNDRLRGLECENAQAWANMLYRWPFVFQFVKNDASNWPWTVEKFKVFVVFDEISVHFPWDSF